MELFENSTLADVAPLYNDTQYWSFNKTLQDYNDEEALRRLAPMIYLGLLMLVGIPGNILVLIVYPMKFPASTHRTFIVALAVADLLVCVSTLPFEIIEMRFQYVFYNQWICKYFRATNNLYALSSIFILMGLSGDRYRRVCTPLKLQMTSRHAKYFIVGSSVVSFLFSWPNFFISGIRFVKLGPLNITGYDCSLSDKFAKTVFPTVYGGLLFLVFIICMVSLIVIYISIGRKVLLHFRFRTKFSSFSSSKSTSDTPILNEPQNTGVEKQMEFKNEVFKDKSSNSVKSKPLLKTKEKRNMSVKEGTASRKLTKIAFAISLAFILSYLPHLTISLLTALKGKFLLKPGPVVSAVLPIVSRSFAINNIVNPVVYGFLDQRFRNGIRELFSR